MPVTKQQLGVGGREKGGDFELEGKALGWLQAFIPIVYDASDVASKALQLRGAIQKLPCWTTTCQFLKSKAISNITGCAAEPGGASSWS